MNMKWIILSLIAIYANNAFAQISSLQIEGTTPDLYITHTVAAKETLYGISKAFNISVNHLSTYNKLHTDAKVSIGQDLRIPLNKTNFSQDGNKESNQLLIPIYYTIQPKEGLYRISVNHNKVSVESLKLWNKLSSDIINTGSSLIVGYLKTKQDQWPIKPVNTTINSVSNSEINTSTSKNTPTPIPESSNNQPDHTPIQPATTPSTKNIVLMGGFFEDAYTNTTLNSTNLQSTTGEAATFKSTSGWQDKKYYVLMNNIAPGTFIKIANPINGTYVCAKVLGSLPDMKENSGLIVRLSNAAAMVLGINDTDKATVQITYQP